MKSTGFAVALLGAMIASAAADSSRVLAEKERLQLDRITRGEVSKDELEIVFAQYDEDLAWSRPYEKVTTVYCKGGAHCAEGSQRLSNVGREGHTFLHHIVKNYDNLAAWTVFSQAGEPTEGYRGHSMGGGHMLTGASFNDYLLHPQREVSKDTGVFFLVTSKVHLPTMQHSMRMSYKTVEGQQVVDQKALPPVCPAHTALEGSSDTWGPYANIPWLQKFVARKCGLDQGSLGDAMLSFWDTFVQLPRPEADIAHFAQGARFAASRKRIQQRPKVFYEKLLSLVGTEVDPCMNYLFEWAWYYIIGMPESAPCDVMPDERQQLSVMGTESVQRVLQAVSGVSGDNSSTDNSSDNSSTPAPTPAPTPAVSGDDETPAPTPAPVEKEYVIEGKVTMTVDDPVAFCGNDAVLDAFADGMANLSSVLQKEWFAVDCATARRLSEGSRRMAGAVDMSYTITVPAGSSAGADADTAMSAISGTTPSELTSKVNTALVSTGLTVTVDTIEAPSKTEVTLTTTTTVTGTLQGTTDSFAYKHAPLGVSAPLMLVLLVATLSG